MDLIVGATGRLGRAVARRLRERGRAVRAMARDPDAADDLRAAGVEVVRGDLRDPASLERAVQGTTSVFAAAHALLGRGRNHMEAVDDAGHRALVDAARRAGAQRFVYTSVLGASPDHPLDFVRTKWGIERHLEVSGLPFVILRPSAFMETHVHQLIGEPLLASGRATLFGRGETPRNFISVDDVARFAVRALEDPDLVGRTVEIGGWVNATNNEIVALYGGRGGRPPRVTRVPVGVLRTFSALLRPVHPGLSRVMRWAALTDEGVLDERFDPKEMVARYGIDPTRLEDWIAARVAERPA
jgi:uncharacterized protein YbjT (DUF2867 family)